MAIPKYDFLDRPYVDDKLEYDYEEQIYVPKVQAILDYTYIDLLKDWTTVENAQSYLYLLSRVVYEIILSYKDAKYRNEMIYYLSHSKKARVELFKIFSDSAWYNRRDGGFMLAYNSGVNLNVGKLIEFGIDKAISPIAQQIIKNSYFSSRVLPFSINKTKKFYDLDDLLDFLVLENYITQDKSDEIENINELPINNTYRVILDVDNQYLFTDLKTLDKAIKKSKIYDNINGDW